ncbi:MAG: phospholipid carrier-dependent glycosyltransferase [Oscillochloridaceae bacterium umkhey_bin13]
MRLPLAIFLLLTGFYLLTMSGHTYSPDEETMLAVTRSLLERGEVALQVEPDAPVSALRPGRDGGRYSPYGVLPSLLAVPFHLVGSWLGGPDPGANDYTSRFAVTALNGPITAATAALITAWAMGLGAQRIWAVILGLGYGLTSLAWPYARTFFSEPLAALLITTAAYALWQAQQTTGRPALFWLIGAGLAAGLLLPTRLAAGVALPVLGLYLLWGSWQATDGRSRRNGPRSALISQPAVFGLGLIPGLAIVLWYNYARFGTPLASGYGSEATLFTTPLAEGLYGLVFSPGKSVLLYAPLIMLALPGAVVLWRHGRAAVVLLGAGLLLGHLLLYASWGVWEGGGVWGPRFLLPVLAPTLVLAAGLGLAPGLGLGRLLLVGLLGMVGLVGNLGGVLLNFSTYVVADSPYDKVYRLAGSSLVGHWRMLGTRWAAYTSPAPMCRLADGLFASEDPGGASLPRRTGAWGELHCTAAGARLRFGLDDRRPPATPASELTLWLDGEVLATPPSGQLREYRLLLPTARSRLRIEAVPWNPRSVGFSERDDNLGPQLTELRGQTPAGATVTLADTAIAPLPARARPRWAWYYDPPNQHLVDHWAWYLPRSELAGPRRTLLALLIIGLGGGLMGVGAMRLRRTMQRGR